MARRPEHKKILLKFLDDFEDSPQYINLVLKFNVTERYPGLLRIAQRRPDDEVGVAAIRALLAKNASELIRQAMRSKDLKAAASTIQALGNSADGGVTRLLFPLLVDKKQPLELRRQATRALAKTRPGAQQLIQLARNNQLDPDLKSAAAFELHLSPAPDVKAAAEKLFPLPPSKDNKPLPAIGALVKMQGDAARGQKIFAGAGTCAKCHVVNGQGKEVGPDLSGIGAKLSRPAMFESVLYPSAGVSHNYETWSLLLDSGNLVTGVLTNETDAEVTIKGADGIARTFKRSEIDEMVKQKTSLMPADLQKVMTAQDLADVVEYISTLKKPAAAATGGP